MNPTQTTRIPERLLVACCPCGAAASIKEDNTINAPCDCSMRDPSVQWTVVEYVPHYVPWAEMAQAESRGYARGLMAARSGAANV